MNCDAVSLMLNAGLDGELSADQRSAMLAHVADCAACRQQWNDLQSLHRELTVVLKPATGPAIDRLMQRITTRPNGPMTPSTQQRRRSSSGKLLVLSVVACTLLLAAATVLKWPTANPAIAEIEVSTGSIDVQQAESRNWIPIQRTGRVVLNSRSRIRTRSGSLCEIRTGCDAIVRLNQDSELVVHRVEKVELVSGELWCRAPASRSLEICGPKPPDQSKVPLFTCPSSAEMQWRTSPDQVMSCVDLSATPVEISMSSASCTIQPGESLSFASGRPDSKGAQRVDTVLETSWQIPLLTLKNPNGSELRQRLISMLTLIGEAKAAYLYEDQIRQLGPAGAMPLIAFVQSVESRQQPTIRVRAMEYATELATRSSLPELRSLQNDPDPTIRQMAQQAVERLQASRLE